MIGRRQLVTLLGGAATWPLAARAQQSTMAVIGVLNSKTPNFYAHLALAFHQRLSDQPRRAWMASSSGFRNPVISLVERKATEADPPRTSPLSFSSSTVMVAISAGTNGVIYRLQQKQCNPFEMPVGEL